MRFRSKAPVAPSRPSGVPRSRGFGQGARSRVDPGTRTDLGHSFERLARSGLARSAADPKPPIQRAREAFRRQDDVLDDFVIDMERLVLGYAKAVLDTPLGWAASDKGYLGRWEREYSRWAETGTKKWIYTSYGYAVEQLTTDMIGSIASSLPKDYEVKSQVTHGHTRPDFAVLDDEGKEVAWIDITADSEGSRDHIKRKQSSSWTTKPYVFEVRYPALDLDQLGSATLSESQILKRRLLAKEAKEAEERNIRSLARSVSKWLQEIDKISGRYNKKNRLKLLLEEEFLLRGQGFTEMTYREIKGLLVLLQNAGMGVSGSKSPLYAHFGFKSSDTYSAKQAKEKFYRIFD